MSSGAAQLRFVADFAVFVVAGAAVALLLLRPALLVAPERLRSLVAIGFALLAGAALASGAGLVAATDGPGLVAVRVAGIALVAIAPLRWPGAIVDRVAMWLGVAALAGAEIALASGGGQGADVARLAGAAAIGIGVLLAARRSIPVRIATSASAIVLAVVLGVAVALSAVLADNVEDEAADRLVAEAGTEASIAAEAGRTAVRSASPAAEALGGSMGEVLVRLGDPAAPDADRLRAAIQAALQQLVDQLIGVFDPAHGPVLLMTPEADGPAPLAVVMPSGDPPDPTVVAQLQAGEVVADAIRDDGERQSVEVAGHEAFGVAAAPVRVASGTTEVTAAFLVVTAPLDSGYLQARQTLSGLGGERGLALLSRSGLVASSGEVGPPERLVALAASAIDGNGRAVRTTGDLLLAAEPVRGADGSPVLAAVATVPSDTVTTTRSELFELLFLIAAGTTLAALVLAALVGEQIGAGLRDLTTAAGAITGGDLTVSPALRSDDELGVLSRAFTSMTSSLRAMTADLRQAADEESRLRTRMEGVVAGMGDALVAVDEHGIVTDFNAAAELLVGSEAARVLGRPVGAVLPLTGDDGRALRARMTEPGDDGWTATATVQTTNGTVVPVTISAGLLRGRDHRTAGAVYVLRDVRREREVERLKGEFLANISHELRTPLSPIKGYSQLLRSRDLPPADVRRFAEEIEKSSARLERVVGQLVDFASMSARGLEIRTESVVVGDLLDGAVGRWRDRIEPGRHVVASRLDGDLPAVWIDRPSIDQALDELVDNAVKYSPDGGPILLNASAGRADGGAVVYLAVVDRGVGIPADRLEDMLEDFTQLDGSATRAFGGLGLGLALVGRIARAHGGSVEVSSSGGTGTSVTLVVPVGAPPEQEAPA